MKNKFKTFRTAKTVVCSFKTFSFVILLLGVISSNSVFGQQSSICQEVAHTFIGVPAATLCDDFGSITYDIEIGEGTSITLSSQLGQNYTGNVYIKGDFTIDEPFQFIDCVVKIEPGSRITVAANVSVPQVPPFPPVKFKLVIDNSKLFPCGDLWDGIVLEDNTNISVKNGSEIEDADCAILVNNTLF